MKLEGFEVYVHSDGEKLPEYQVKVDQNSKQATCFIPSQTGKVSTSTNSSGTCTKVLCIRCAYGYNRALRSNGTRQ